MHYTGTTFRPPYEARSIILQATAGCSHNSCAFCSMYRDVAFEASPLHEIEDDLVELAAWRPSARRVFLANGDAFCLPASRLEQIAVLIRSYLPQVETIGCYASINNVATKSDDELALLARLGFSDINIGLESGLDDVLVHMNKGYDAATARRQMARLHDAGLPFNLNVINAAAGPDRILEAAQANAAIVNEARPTLVFVSPLHADPGTPLADEVAAGDFPECTWGQYVVEELEFLRRLNVEDCVFFGLHVSNPIPVSGVLPRDKDRLIQALENGLDRMPAELANSHPTKGAEGRVVN